MKSIIYLLLGLSYTVFGYDSDALDSPLAGPYKMGTMITCYEQNDENYQGYKDKIYSNLPDKETGEISPMCLNEDGSNDEGVMKCDRYADTAFDNAGTGDVCDHTDPNTNIQRNACYFNTIFGAEVNEEKTWSYKCWEISQCPLKDYRTGEGRVGCQVTRQRITCCCQDDYCNGGGLLEEFAAYGNPDKYPPNYQDICDIDFSKYEWYIRFTIEATGWTDQQNYECSYDPDGIDFNGDYDTDTIGDDINDDINDDDEGTTYDINDDQQSTTDNKCLITDRTGSECSCGGDCTSTEYEYRATTEKCGDAELVTGEFGAETCDPENPVYEIGQEVCCQVIDCANGEFRITSDGYMNGICVNFITLFCILIIIYNH